MMEIIYPALFRQTPERLATCALCGLHRLLSLRDVELGGDGLCADCVMPAAIADRALARAFHDGLCRPDATP